MINTEAKKGFTLLELLIVIAIIAILSAILIFILNPAQTLRKARDSQRISDFATVNSAIGLYVTTVSSPALCTSPVSLTTSSIYVSVPSGTTPATGGALPTGCAWASAGDSLVFPASLTAAAAVNGTGWIPVNFTAIPDGSPIGSLPQDPSLSGYDWTGDLCVSGAATPGDNHPAYRFTCLGTTGNWEMDAELESTEFFPKEAADGGNNANRYEEGTNKAFLP